MTASGTNRASNVWLLDLGIALLGLLVMFTVLRVLRFDDPRILYNAWTYCLAIPTVIISSTMLAHVMIPQNAERSIQTGFLLSVLVHLGLTLAAINTVLFSGLWQEGTEKIEMKLKSMSQGTSFQVPAVNSDNSVPDYLRPVQNQIDPATDIELKPTALPPESLELLQTPNEIKIDTNKTLQDDQLASVTMDQPAVQAQEAQNIQRPEFQVHPIRPAAIQAPTVQQTPLAQDSLPESKPLSVDRATSDPVASLQRATEIPQVEPMAQETSPINMSAALEASAMALQRLRIERQLSNAIESTNAAEAPTDVPPKSSKPTDRAGSLSGIPTKVPLDKIPREPRATDPAPSTGGSGGSASQSLGDLLGDRGSMTRRNPTSSAALSSDSPGGLVYSDPIANSAASSWSKRSSIELPRISDAAGTLPGLENFRPASSSNKQASGGLVPIPAPAFQQRARRMDDSSNEELKAMGPLGPKTQESIERGLEFLAKHQRSDGSWKLEDFGQKTVIRSDTAATALSLLSFQGAGYSHVQFKYQKECRKAIDFLVSGQKLNGDLYRSMDEASDRNGWIYSHAIATLALCEAYGMTRDENLRASAQQAVDFLVDSQDRQEGGWRYAPRIGSDTSVTGWGMMALKSAELSGLYVPGQTFQGIEKWLDHSQASAREKFLYRYNWLANQPETKHGTLPTPVMTSVGLLMRLYMGWKRDNPAMAQGADWLLRKLPADETSQTSVRDTYYWYYATQVLFHMGGQRWKSWYESLYPMLIESQVTQGPYAGSWEPMGPVPDAWGEYAGRLYVTTMNLLSLEVTYRHLPIYEATSR
jgi:hypothetical protein